MRLSSMPALLVNIFLINFEPCSEVKTEPKHGDGKAIERLVAKGFEDEPAGDGKKESDGGEVVLQGDVDGAFGLWSDE